MSTSVIIYDSHPLIVDGLSSLVSTRGYNIITATSDPAALIHSAVLDNPDLIILDPLFLNESYLEKIGHIKKIHDKIRIFVFAGADSVYHIMRGHKLEMHGYLSKHFGAEEINFILDKMEAGEQMILRSADPTPHTQDDADLIHTLTNRELQVLRELGAGKTNKTIAAELKLSTKTVSTYKRSIMQKMQTQKVRDVVDFARRNGF